jgi:hypothetical protein
MAFEDIVVVESMRLALSVAGNWKDSTVWWKTLKKEWLVSLSLEWNVNKHGEALLRAFSTIDTSSCEYSI